MADEITITISGTVINGNFKEEFKPGTKKYDQGTVGSAAGTVSCSSDSTTINLGSVAAAGWAFLTNVSTAVEILVGPSTTAYFLRLPIESSHAFHLVADTTINVQTTANTANLQYIILST